MNPRLIHHYYDWWKEERGSNGGNGRFDDIFQLRGRYLRSTCRGTDSLRDDGNDGNGELVRVRGNGRRPLRPSPFPFSLSPHSFFGPRFVSASRIRVRTAGRFNDPHRTTTSSTLSSFLATQRGVDLLFYARCPRLFRMANNAVTFPFPVHFRGNPHGLCPVVHRGRHHSRIFFNC